MPKAIESQITPRTEEVTEINQQQMDSKYHLIIVAAQRSKQIQRGARPRVDMDLQRHKATRVALEEVQCGKVDFSIIESK